MRWKHIDFRDVWSFGMTELTNWVYCIKRWLRIFSLKLVCVTYNTLMLLWAIRPQLIAFLARPLIFLLGTLWCRSFIVHNWFLYLKLIMAVLKIQQNSDLIHGLGTVDHGSLFLSKLIHFVPTVQFGQIIFKQQKLKSSSCSLTCKNTGGKFCSGVLVDGSSKIILLLCMWMISSNITVTSSPSAICWADF